MQWLYCVFVVGCVYSRPQLEEDAFRGQQFNRNNQQLSQPQQQAFQDFQCPTERNGFFPDPFQCDKYWDCYNGYAEEKLCPDGLVFFDFNSRREKCDFPFQVDCGDRNDLQVARPTYSCPRRNGFFAHEDPRRCDVFIQCVDGSATETICPGGLYFDEYAGTCTWPTPQQKKACNQVNDVLEDGFNCKNVTTQRVNGLDLVHPRFTHPTDCQLFYVCLNGKKPRLVGCPDQTVYNEQSMQCDNPLNVPGCENWFEPLDYDLEPVVQVGDNSRRQ